jgi:hypothetical protein
MLNISDKQKERPGFAESVQVAFAGIVHAAAVCQCDVLTTPGH